MNKEYTKSKKYEEGNLYEGSPEKTVILDCISSLLNIESEDLIKNYPNQISNLVNEMHNDDSLWTEFDNGIARTIKESGFSIEE